MDVAAAERIVRLHLALAGDGYARFADRRDLELAAWIEDRFPGTGKRFASAFRFHAKAARWAVAQDRAAGVLFGASTFQGAVPAHHEALAANPGARVVYAAFSGEVVFVTAALLGGQQVCAVQATVRDPAALMSLPEVEALGSPIQLQLQLCGHFWPARMCRELVGEYARLLPEGSTLVLTLWSPDGTVAGDRFLDMLAGVAGWPAYGHSPEDVGTWLEEARLEILGNGPSDVRAYERGWAEEELADWSPGRVIKAVARKA